MPRPSRRTKTRKRTGVTLPGGRETVHFRKKKVGATRCHRCGGSLSGFSRLTPSKARGLSSTQRKVERAYGGRLCHRCLQYLLKREVRSL